jgi:hypothetical protein
VVILQGMIFPFTTQHYNKVDHAGILTTQLNPNVSIVRFQLVIGHWTLFGHWKLGFKYVNNPVL